MSSVLAPPRPQVSPPPELARTLDDVVARTWEVLRAGLPAACLVCGDELEGPGPCAGCGTTLS
jgi:hypothetical protein